MKKLINYLMILGTTILLVACNKEKLSPIPETSLPDELAFTTAGRIQQQVFSVYSSLKNGNLFGGRVHVYNEVRGEDWLNVTANGVTSLFTWNFGLVSTNAEVENCWTAGYNTINRANVVLKGIDENASVIPNATLVNRYRAEVRLCRALSYFALVTLYNKKPYNFDNGTSPGVPLRLLANKDSSNNALARSTVAAVFNQILTDLNFAEANLPISYPAPISDSNVVRAHRNTAIALKTRVLLHMGRYADVIIEGNKIVSAAAPFQASTGVNSRLHTSTAGIFATPYTTSESIFSMPMNTNNPPGLQNDLAVYWNAEFRLNPSGIVADANWKSTDTRRAFIYTSGTTLRHSKFNDGANNFVPVIRYAEVMLNLAEALARVNGVDTRAIALLNAVRQRSDPTTTFAPATQNDLVNLILNEKRIEFLGEGMRSLEIMRLSATFPAKGTVGSVAVTSPAYVFPIPNTELLFNPLMTSN